MKKILLAFLIALPMLAGASSVDDLTFTDPYVRAVPPRLPNSAAYLEIKNNSDQPIELVSVSSTFAKKAELHEVIIKEGVAKMQKVDKWVLSPNSTTKLTPGGLHIMLLGLKETLKPGQTVPLTLHFGDGASKTLEASVRDIRGRAQHHH